MCKVIQIEEKKLLKLIDKLVEDCAINYQLIRSYIESAKKEKYFAQDMTNTKDI